MTKHWKKITADNFFLIKNYNLLFSRPPKPSKLRKKPSALKREHPALQNMKFRNFVYFCGPFLLSWIRIRIRIPNTDPDPHQLTRLNSDTIRIRGNPDENGKVLKLRADVESWLVNHINIQQPNSTIGTLCTSQPWTGNGCQICCSFLNDFYMPVKFGNQQIWIIKLLNLLLYSTHTSDHFFHAR